MVVVLMSDNASEVFLTAKEVSEMSGGIGVATLHRWAALREAGLPTEGPRHRRLASRHRRWALSDVQAWLAESTVE